MTGHDDEFDDFLARRRKLFRRPEEDVLEPPDEVDRIVLRQAREAIETRGTQRQIRGLAWGAPLAIAATLLVAFTLILHVGMPRKTPVGEVTVEQVAQRRDYPPPPVASEAAANARTQPAVADTQVATVAKREQSSSTPAAAPQPSMAGQADAKAASAPEWRRDSRTWLAEIQQLRAAGKDAEADAELAEYKRQHRAYAGDH